MGSNVNTSSSERRMWLVRVPKILHSLVSDASSSAPLGFISTTDTTVSGGPGGGPNGKRQRWSLTLEQKKMSEILGDEVVRETPNLWNLDLDLNPVFGARVISLQGSTCTFLGKATCTGSFRADPTDPKTQSYNRAVATKREDPNGVKQGGMKRPRFERMSQEQALALASTKIAASAPTVSTSSSSLRGPPKTLLEMFEHNAHWKKNDIVTKLRAAGLREEEIDSQIKEKLDYVRSGKFSSHYIVKHLYLVPSMPRPDATAEAARPC